MKLVILVLATFLGQSVSAQVPKLPDAKNFDTMVNGKKISLFYIENKNGYKAAITNLGGKMAGFIVKDKKGKWVDIVPGYDRVKPYFADKSAGAIVGRFANRIAKGRFTLDGKEYQLPVNNGENTLHGGPMGFYAQVWDAKQLDASALQLNYFSKHGEEGFPGNMNVKVIYRLTDKNELVITYEATTDQRTPINLTNHNYWNLNGEGNGLIDDHRLQIFASKYTPVNKNLIPTGIAPVKNTPFDFLKMRTIKDSLQSGNEQLIFANGYDHNFVLDKGLTKKPQLAAIAVGDKSGIVLKVYTTEPGIQFYGGNFMTGKNTWKNRTKNHFRTALALETQHFPDSPNQPGFPSTVLDSGKVFTSTTIYKVE